jgi:hypothetical protein
MAQMYTLLIDEGYELLYTCTYTHKTKLTKKTYLNFYFPVTQLFFRIFNHPLIKAASEHTLQSSSYILKDNNLTHKP